jgi:hypothetical protein
MLMIISFGLSWIPYISLVGGLIGIIGVILLLLGRRAYGESYRSFVVFGGGMILFTLVAGLVLAVGFAAAIVGQAGASSGNPSQLSVALENDLYVLFVAAAALGIIGSLGQVFLVYELSDGTARILLWSAFAVSAILSFLIVAILLPQIDGVITQVLSSSPPDTGPINQLEYTSDLLGLSKAIPSFMFLWAYYRARTEGIRRSSLPALPSGAPTG